MVGEHMNFKPFVEEYRGSKLCEPEQWLPCQQLSVHTSVSPQTIVSSVVTNDNTSLLGICVREGVQEMTDKTLSGLDDSEVVHHTVSSPHLGTQT